MKDIILTDEDMKKAKLHVVQYNAKIGIKTKHIEKKNGEVFLIYKQLGTTIKTVLLGKYNGKSTTIK